MGKILIYSEKPDMGKAIASAIEAGTGRFKKGRSYWENDTYIVTWGIGHLLTAKMPDEYPEIAKHPRKGWDWDAIPFYPPGDTLEYAVNPKTKEQFSAVKTLLKRADVDTVINACDAGREGELIFSTVYDYVGCKKPVKRLWVNDLNKKAILKAMNDLRGPEFYKPRAEAAYARQFADWSLGLILTRAYSIKAREVSEGKVSLHVGRVQTPVISILVQRLLEIENFVPEAYFELQATFGDKYKGQWFKEKPSNTRFKNKEEAESVRSKVEGKVGVVVKKDVTKKPKQHPPLYSLGLLQKELNSKLGFSTEKTDAIAQVLYEKYKLTTYPRTSSQYLTDEFLLEDSVQAVNHGPYAPFAQTVIDDGIKTKKSFVNNKEVGDHHAIVPTEKKANLEAFEDEKVKGVHVKGEDIKKVYDFIVKRFLCVFYPDAIYEKTSIVTDVEGETFKTNGNILVKPGWKEVYGAEASQEDENGKDKETTLPPIELHEKNPVTEAKVLSKETQPPKHYTEGSLVEVMINPKKFLEDKEMKKALSEAQDGKGAGLGTDATRTETLKKIKMRGYAKEVGKNIVATKHAVQFITVAPDELKSPIITAEWEQRLSFIEEGKGDRKAFEKDLKAYIQRNIDYLKSTTMTVSFESPSDAKQTEYACPKCQSPIQMVIYKGMEYYICKNHKKEEPCFRLYQRTLGKKLTKNQMKEILTNGETKSVVKGLKSQAKKTNYDAKIKFDIDQVRMIPVFDQSKPKAAPLPKISCPFCGRGVEENAKAFGCTAWKEKKKCSFTLWKNDSKKLNVKQVEKIIQTGQTDLIDDMKGKKGKYAAYYVLNTDAKTVKKEFLK
ncbi:hypothetical protein IMZ31_21190 (plasmid) [Pontibacillus sp. ALD_SL1]|uniref:type IA DNA topoisomerase n=1 Tax=Pontibacillus sp. ALD_SL1 TaxID=2777185 RepID=UPI001A957354|nr:type IA DNA topoisomerase [Pontibacillus sp. ALD_SL1]QST03066.1 hypothetical protein IMZ31_21190 [Pontibacillus sp. ALD_SL1]